MAMNKLQMKVSATGKIDTGIIAATIPNVKVCNKHI
jgi:hypothetical protein